MSEEGVQRVMKPTICTAATGRSKCQQCKEPISAGTQRVGMPDQHNGLTIVRWVHPRCFAANLLIDAAPTGRAKCAADATPVGKGEPRLLMRLMSCDGSVKTQKIYKPQNAREFLAELGATDGIGPLDAKTIAGVGHLAPEQQEWVADALSGRDVSSRPVPRAEVSKPSRSLKRKPAESVDEDTIRYDTKADTKGGQKKEDKDTKVDKRPRKKPIDEETKANEGLPKKSMDEDMKGNNSPRSSTGRDPKLSERKSTDGEKKPNKLSRKKSADKDTLPALKNPRKLVGKPSIGRKGKVVAAADKADGGELGSIAFEPID